MPPNPPFVANEIPPAAKWNTLVGVYDRSTSVVNAVFTASETIWYTKTIGAGHMSTDRMLRLTLIGDYWNTTGATSAITVRVYFGGTVLYARTGTFPITAQRTMSLKVVVANTTTGSQVSQMWMNNFYAVGSQEDRNIMEELVSFSAVDTTVAKDLIVSVQHATSSASIYARKIYALLELL